jgi:hypothetical protein
MDKSQPQSSQMVALDVEIVMNMIVALNEIQILVGSQAASEDEQKEVWRIADRVSLFLDQAIQDMEISEAVKEELEESLSRYDEVIN